MPPLRNDWAAWQFDGAILWEGLTIENALNGSEEYGPVKLEQILAPEFRLRAQGREPALRGKDEGGLGAMIAANPRMVSHWKQGS